MTVPHEAVCTAIAARAIDSVSDHPLCAEFRGGTAAPLRGGARRALV